MNAPRSVPFDDDWDGDEPGIFEVEDPELEARLDAEAEADIAAGRVVSNEAVMEWLASKRTDNPLPRPTWGN